MDISAKSIVSTAMDENGNTVKRTAGILWGIKDIPAKSPMSTVYVSQPDEAVRILKEMGIKPQNRILVVALPESGWECTETTELPGSV